MDNKDFEKLKEICNHEGFQLINEYPDDNDKFYVIKKKKIDDSEFVTDGNYIYKALQIQENSICFKSPINGLWELATKENLKPSTENHYLDQLIEMAFKKYGNIKLKDHFITPNGLNNYIKSIYTLEWEYYKKTDRLYFGGLLIFQKGKWAERLNRVKVKFYEISYYEDDFKVDFTFQIDGGQRNFNGSGKYLEKQLEKFLNGENDDEE